MALRVLLADNSESIKKVIQISLQDKGVDLKIVSSGLDVLEIAQKFQPNLIFVDILLQKKSGYDVSRELKLDPRLKSTPVILMWSGFMDLDEERAQESLADFRLEKPFDAETLKNMVKQALQKFPSTPTQTTTPTKLPPISEQHIEFPHDPIGSMPINIRDHLETPESVPMGYEPPELLQLPEIDLSPNAEEFQQIEINQVPNFANQTEEQSFELKLPEDREEVEISFDEPKPVENLDFLLNKKTNPSFRVNELKTIKANEVTTAIKLPDNLPPNLTQVQLEELIKSQCHEIIEKMAWKMVPDLASKIIKDELNRLIHDNKL